MITVVNRHTVGKVKSGVVRFSVGRLSSGTGPGCRPAHALANPYSHMHHTTAAFRVATREESVERFRPYLVRKVKERDAGVLATLSEMVTVLEAGSDVEIECFCKNLSCHGDFIKELLELRMQRAEK